MGKASIFPKKEFVYDVFIYRKTTGGEVSIVINPAQLRSTQHEMP